MERATQRIGLVNLAILLVIAGCAGFLASYSGSLSAVVSLAFLGFGFLVAAMSYFQMRLEESERLEKLEFEELNKAKGGASLFNITDADIFPAQRSREQFERIFLPLFGIVLFLLQAGGAYFLGRRLLSATPAEILKPTLVLSLFALFALVLFLLGKYSASRARIENLRLLRPGASYVLLDAYVCFLVTASIAAVEFGFRNVDLWMARALVVVLALGAAESLINLVLEIYRPRVKGRAARPLYESRIVGLLAQPEGLVTTAAHALDYQFGFKVSETWFYRFLERALAWIILLQMAAFWISSTVVFINPGEQAVLERLGRPVESRGVLESGVHFKFPWPIDRVWRAPTSKIQRFSIGMVPDPAQASVKTILWTVPHYLEETPMLVASRATNAGTAGSIDLLNVSIPVEFVVQDLKLWTYNHHDPANLLEEAATREVVRYLVGVDMLGIMSTQREQAEKDLQALIQKAADDLSLGARIVFVGLQDIHPPIAVAGKFEEVNAAQQDKQATILKAQAYRAGKLSQAEIAATRRVNDSRIYAAAIVANAQATAAIFTNQVAAYHASPELYEYRLRARALSAQSTNGPHFILFVTNRTEMIQLNLENNIRRDLLDVAVPTTAQPPSTKP